MLQLPRSTFAILNLDAIHHRTFGNRMIDEDAQEPTAIRQLNIGQCVAKISKRARHDLFDIDGSRRPPRPLWRRVLSRSFLG